MKSNWTKIFFLAHILFLYALNSVQAQESLRPQFLNISADELLNHQKENETTKSDEFNTAHLILNPKEVSSVVYVLNKDEIQLIGARDLQDVLRLVPGFDHIAHYGNVKGISFRGLAGTEGKILVMINGNPINETSIGSVWADRFILPNTVEKIEIVRGAGSVIYGGFAGLAVINIITMKGDDLRGAESMISYSHSNGGFINSTQGISLGSKTQNGIIYSLNYNGSFGNLNNESITAENGQTFHYGDSAKSSTSQMDINLEYKDLEFSYIYHNYRFQDPFYTYPAEQKNETHSIQAGYHLKAGDFDQWTISPKISFHQNTLQSFEGELVGFNSTNRSLKAGLFANYDYSENLNIYIGGESVYDESTPYKQDNFEYFNNQSSLSYFNYAFFTQALYKSKYANITLGMRFSNHPVLGAIFTPKVGITKSTDHLHFKLIYSEAFRAPTVNMINANQEIAYEKIKTAEIEAGYHFTQNMSLISNLYYTTLNDAHVFNNIQASPFESVEKMGTSGIEIDYKYKWNKGLWRFNYSFYMNNTDTDELTSLNERNLWLGTPAHKISSYLVLKIKDKINLSPSLSFFSKKYSYYLNENGSYSLTTIDPDLLLNLSTEFQDIISQGINLSIGIYDILNSKYQYANRNMYSITPVSATSREIRVTLGMDIK